MTLSDRIKQTPALAYLIVMLAPLFWAGNGVLGRGVVGVIPPISLAFWRWVIASILMLIFTWPSVRKAWPTVRDNLGITLAISFLGIACFNTLQYIALTTTTATNASLVGAIMPASIVVLSWFILRERISLLQILSVGMSFLGVVLVITRASWQVVRDLAFVQGDLVILIGVLLYAVYSVLLRRRPHVDRFAFTTISFVMGAVMLIPFYLWELATVGGFSLNPAALGSLAYVGIFPSIFSYLSWDFGVQHLGSNTTGLFIYMLPVFTTILAIVILGEQFEWYHAAGFVLIVSGMILFNRQRQAT